MVKKKNEKLEKLRHSTAHVMADAVIRLYPGVKLAIGPAIEEGFYYDFDFSGCKVKSLIPEDLAKIEKEMAKIIKENQSFQEESISRKDAIKRFKKTGDVYKVELLEEIKDDTVTLYTHGEFVDLCKGPHISSTGEIGAFKLLALAGAYWRGDEKNVMLQRIYGTAFENQKDLDEFLHLRDEAQKRDHRKLGRELELYSFDDAMGAGLVLYHPKGAMLRQIIVDYITNKHIEKGYELISSPHILKSDIWIRSGHYEYYKDLMYIFESDKQEYAVKPMNCPGHILVYSSKVKASMPAVVNA